MLVAYPSAVKHVFRFWVSATVRFYPFFSPLYSQFFLKFSLLDTTEGLGHVYFHIPKLYAKNRFKLTLSYCDFSIEHVCLGTNMADSNRRQGRSHVGENQELYNYFSKNCVPIPSKFAEQEGYRFSQ